MAEPLRNIIDAGWAEALEPVTDRIAAMGEFLRAEVAAGAGTCLRVRTCCGRSSSRSPTSGC